MPGCSFAHGRQPAEHVRDTQPKEVLKNLDPWSEKMVYQKIHETTEDKDGETDSQSKGSIEDQIIPKWKHDHTMYLKQLSKFDFWTRDQLRFARRFGKLANPFSIEEAFSYLEIKYSQAQQCGNVKSSEDENTRRNKRASNKLVSTTNTAPVMHLKTTLCFVMTGFAEVLAENSPEGNTSVLFRQDYMIWIVLVMTFFLLLFMAIFFFCYSWKKTTVVQIRDVEQQPFIDHSRKNKDDTPSIATLRHRIFGLKTNVPRQRGGGSNEYKIDLGRRIGCGRLSQVYEATYQGKKVAAKRYMGFDKNTRNVLEKEYRILKKLSHENITKVLYFDEQHDTLLLELCSVTGEDGETVSDLKDWTQKCKKKTALTYASLMKQATGALDYLHRYVKVQNLI